MLLLWGNTNCFFFSMLTSSLFWRLLFMGVTSLASLSSLQKLLVNWPLTWWSTE